MRYIYGVCLYMPLLFIKLISLRTLGVHKLNQSLFQKENIELHLFFFLDNPKIR